jgi:hypothetical protein
MAEFIRSFFGLLFFEDDLPGFVAAGWLSGQQAEKLTKKEEADA